MTYRKLFHWGIVFWLLVWLVFTCTSQTTRVTMKGGGSIAVSIGDGAVSIYPWLSTGFQPEEVDYYHEEIWLGYKPRLIRKYPEFLIGRLAKIGPKHDNPLAAEYSFPIPGFLILWLAAGLYGEMKLIRHPAAMPVGGGAAIVGSRRRIVILGAGMIALCGVIGLADHLQREQKVALSCAWSIGGIRSDLWKKPVGEPLLWDQYFAPGGELRPQDRKCPSGAPYLFSPVKLPGGGCPAQCSRADHRRYLEGAIGVK